MNGHLAKIVVSLAIAGVLGAVGVYAKQGTIDVRVAHTEEDIRELKEAVGETRKMFYEILRRLPEE